MKPPLFSCLTSSVANNGSLYGRFLLGPLPIDISLTVATVLRRSLLHSQATFSIVSAEIEGATHEYASLPGIQESVLEILLNLGEIVLTTSQRNFLNPNFRTSIGTAGFYFAFIKVSGPGVVTAKDINWPKGIFCVKPNTVIATLSSNETLTMRLKISCSLNKNKQSLYEIKENKKPINTNEIKNNKQNNKGNKKTLLSLESQNLKKNTSDSYESTLTSNMSNVDSTNTPTSETIARASINSSIVAGSSGQPGSFGPTSPNSKIINEKEIKVYKPDKRNQSLIEDPETYKNSKGLINKDPALANEYHKVTLDNSINIKKNTNEINQFSLFKTKETKEKSSKQNLLLKKQSLSRLLSRKSLAKHFKRIKKKNLLISTTLTSLLQENNVFTLDFPDKTNTIKSFDTRKTKKEDFHSYTIKKQNSLKQVSGKELDITNKEGIFIENNNKTIRNENLINENQKIQNNRNTVTFQVLEGLFNDFENLALSKDQVLTNKKSNFFSLESSLEGIKRLNGGSIILKSPNNPENKKPTLKINTLHNKTTGQELDSITNKEIEKSTLSLAFPKKNQQKKNSELLVMSSSYPVEKVNFLIERDDELLGYRHRIILEVWTNGSISPRQAIFESIGSIIKLIYNFREPLKNNLNLDLINSNSFR